MPPLRRSKLRIVRQMIRQAVGQDADPEAYLSGRQPQRIHFPNHRSAAEHAAFVTAEVGKGIQTGVMAEWRDEWGPPTVINGLRVVEGKKLRLCMNPMYINQHMEVPALKYESVKDLPGYLRRGSFMFTTDDKSGYWNLQLHPSMYPYAAFEWQGRVLFWPVLAFGFAPACWTYSLLKQELFRPLRERGVDLSYLIDDCLAAAQSRAAAQYLCRALVRLLTALGFTLSLDKCQLQPAQRVRFLGFIVDAGAEAFEVPPEKVEALAEQVRALAQAPAGSITRREVARVAGRIMAMSPAVATAPLHARVVGRALAGSASWDAAVGDAESFLARAQLFVELLRTKNGKTWWRRATAVVLRVAGDASDRAYAAFLPERELGPGSASEMRVPFTPEEAGRMDRGELSSTERELRTVTLAVQWIAEQASWRLQGGWLQYQTDSQAAECCVLGMKGKGPCLLRVDELYRLCAAYDLEVQLVWFPSTAPLQQVADALSKYEDGSQWVLKQEVWLDLWAEPCLNGRSPSLDVFADAHTAKLPRFFAKSWSPGAAGIDAFAQDWGRWSRGGLLYINPPFDQMGRVVRKIEEEQPDCVLIAPVWPRWWRAALGRLPVRARRRLPHVPDLFTPGPQVPGAHGRGPKAPRYAVEALYVLWGNGLA
ncbi:hypothetical protein GPECTOR_1018g286 [Gonium pectorale]|uniref:Reverse transcriptase domain-containing protein n=1 Tax=Gonium pectorale TaxID=33097 RepID=A0A150FTS2_GONPE|nr:hypothetical protein GPECTOR_1018g286 [Gonium pectorale]|eukprot:KXZ40999.1 hypothetical protein GPECTOR_1018g286 [Gonium pectorale]